MNLKYALLLFILSILSMFQLNAQGNELSPTAEISILTIGPGDNLNDAFGHNGFRINDGSLGMDIVFGYGEYDFETPNFYLKFAQGKLNYKISLDYFSDFYRQYAIVYNRTIEEQVLDLSQTEKQNLYEFLINNYQPENRKYLYDFFYDNCATKIRDVAENAIEGNIEFNPPDNFEPKTFRKLIHDHTGRNTWGSFGIDLALGAVIDKEATPREHMYLPVYIHEFFGNATLNGTENLVKKSTVLYQRVEPPTESDFLWSPLMIFGILALIILYITYMDFKNHRRSKWLDISIFAITGTIGIVVLLLWFATDHSATANNYNLLWAFPINLFVIGQLLKPQVKGWFKKYLKFLIILLVLMTFHWVIGIQVFALAMIPLMVALVVRYVFLLNRG